MTGFVAFSKVSTLESVFKSFHSGERFQKFAVTVCVFAGYVRTKAGSVTKCLQIQTNPDTCGQGLSSPGVGIIFEKHHKYTRT